MKNLLFLFLFISQNIFSQNIDSLLSNMFFQSNLNSLDTNGYSFSFTHSPSTSTWSIDSFPESVVYHSGFSYDNLLDTNKSYKIRIGKGGQLYSFDGSFGESVPPQWVHPNWVQPSYAGGTSYAPWVDEVWQLVCVDESQNNPPDSAYFIHQAGVYLKTPTQNKPFYSPKVAEYFNQQNQSYTIVNWGQQAHTDDLLNINHTSSLLYYTQYTNKGKGIVQVDHMIYNFGQDNISFLNVPWGGVRNSSLDHFFISTPFHTYNLTTGLYGQAPIVQTANTGGWVAWSNDTLGNSPALGMVHPLTTNTYGNKFRYGDAGNLSAAWNNRDYHVFEMVRQPFPGQLGFGKSMSFRYFYVLGANVDSVKYTILQNNLVSHALDTAFIPSIQGVDSVKYSFQLSGSQINEGISINNNGLLLRTSPYSNSYPLFKITSFDSIDVINSNPYYFSEIAYDGITEEIKLLGFLDQQSTLSVIQDTVCYGVDYIFPDGSVALLTNDTSFVNTIAASNPLWDSIIVTNINVRPLLLGIDSIVVCDSFTWINGITYSSSNSTATHNLIGSNGCDSIVSLNLVLTLIDTAVLLNGLDIVCIDPFAFYQWLNCDSNYSIIPGAINQSFTALSNGSYAVEISKNGCIDTSSCVNISTVSLVYKEGLLIELYPNPTSGKVTINGLDKIEPISYIKIKDGNGKKIKSISVSQSQIDFSTYKDGVYYIEIKSSKGIREIKVLVIN